MTNSQIVSQIIGGLPEEWTWGDLITIFTAALDEKDEKCKQKIARIELTKISEAWGGYDQ